MNEARRAGCRDAEYDGPKDIPSNDCKYNSFRLRWRYLLGDKTLNACTDDNKSNHFISTMTRSIEGQEVLVGGILLLLMFAPVFDKLSL